MSEEQSFMSLRARLEETLEWPHEYVFKFIVKAEKGELLKMLFEGDLFSERYSQGGKYLSLTVVKQVDSSEEVISVYEKVRSVPGVIML